MPRTRENEYKKDSHPEKSISDKVRMWRKRIDDAHNYLKISERIQWAEDANLFLAGAKTVPTRGRKTAKTYINYSLPLMEELLRTAIPNIPIPVIEGRTKAAFVVEQKTQQFLNYQFEKNADAILDVIDSGQWDDSKMGVAVFKVDWKMTSEEAEPTAGASQENVDIQSARASAENIGRDAEGKAVDPIIAESDLDIVHLKIHDPFFASMPDSLRRVDMEAHVAEHRARLNVIVNEGVRIGRVPPGKYIYDDSCGWEKRGWECEIKDVRVKYLLENGYKNVNPRNAPPNDSDAEIAYEDKFVRIGEIHDRLNGREYTIPILGDGGQFLMDRAWRYKNHDIYKLVTFHPFNPDQSWGMAIMFSLIPILNELAIVDYNNQRHIANHPNKKIIVSKGAGAKDIKKGIKDPDQMIIEVSQDQADSIKMFDPTALPAENRAWRSDLLNELRRVVGLDAQDTGQSNPHKVSATESYARSQSSVGRLEDRQKVIASLLSWFARMMLSLYRDFAEKSVEIKINRGQGPEWKMIEPRDLPIDVDISFSIEAKTDKATADNMSRVDRVNQYLRTSQVPIDEDRLNVWTMRNLGVKRPEQFRIAGPAGPQNVQDTKGQPGVQGSSEAPVGTQQNTEANARFAGGADALAEAQEL